MTIGPLRKGAGWTLIEAIVAMGLALVVLMVVSRTLISTSRATQAQNQRAMRQASLQSAMRHLETMLMQSLVSGVGWRPSAGGGVLTAHCLQGGFITTTPKLQTSWRVVLWDETRRKLYMGDSTTAGGFTAPLEDKAQIMPQAQMDAILAGEMPPVYTLFKGRPIADRVTNFEYELEEGPLFRIELEIDVPPRANPEPGDAAERLKASVLIQPRNRI